MFFKALAALTLALVLGLGQQTAEATPVRTQTISNLVGTDLVTHRCDATGGHCARLHLVVQSQNGAQIRGYASVQCYLAGGPDFNCAYISGNTWLDNLSTGASFNGPITTCSSCHAALSAVTPWATLPIQSYNWQQSCSFAVTTGAVGGGSITLSAPGPEFHI